MSEDVKPVSFMGYKLNENGEVAGAMPELQHIITNFTDRIIKEQESYVYKECWKLNIDPNVLEKQIIEIKRLNYIIQQKDIQIEKMKCCGNCKYCYEEEYDGINCDLFDGKTYVPDIKKRNCDKWEFAG